MRMKYALLALVPIGLVLQLGVASAAPNRELGVRWEGSVEPETSKLVVYNLSARPAKAFLGSRAVSIPADGVTEIPAAGLGTGTLRLRSAADLLVLQAREDFDAASVRIASGQSGQAGEKLLRESVNPEWARELIADGPNVRHGALGAVTVKSEDPTARVEVAVEFVASHSAVRIRQLDALGNEVTSVVASASRPVRWRASLGPVNGESRIELRTLQGEAQGTAAAVVEGAHSRTARSPIAPLEKVGGGVADFVPDINWDRSPDLMFYVTGGPASVCGDLHISRNFATPTVTPGWICTNSSGNASAGPWTWANQNGTEYAEAYIVWSNGLSTNTAIHRWDKTPPTAAITSSGGSPAPISFSGTGNDVGAGFSSSWGSSCSNYFYDWTTDDYWDPSSNQYINAHFPVHVACTISGMPSTSVNWSQSQIPPGFAHKSGHCYEWAVFLYESSESTAYGNAKINFCVP